MLEFCFLNLQGGRVRRISSLGLALFSVVTLSRCATNVLSPVTSSGEPLITEAPPAPQDGAATNLIEILHAKGYEGVGLRYESAATIDLLTKVFNDARTANRQIAFIYTGVAMAYDTNYKSLTVAGTQTVDAILKFIDKNVPVKADPSKESQTGVQKPH
jgi:hypothetical protein